jgi:hypothetical protein
MPGKQGCSEYTLRGPVTRRGRPHQAAFTSKQHLPTSQEADAAATTTQADLIIGACMRTSTPFDKPDRDINYAAVG